MKVIAFQGSHPLNIAVEFLMLHILQHNPEDSPKESPLPSSVFIYFVCLFFSNYFLEPRDASHKCCAMAKNRPDGIEPAGSFSAGESDKNIYIYKRMNRMNERKKERKKERKNGTIVRIVGESSMRRGGKRWECQRILESIPECLKNPKTSVGISCGISENRRINKPNE